MLCLPQEGAQSLVHSPGEVGAESAAVNLDLWLKLLVEAVGITALPVVVHRIARWVLALRPRQDVTLRIHGAGGESREVPLTLRIGTPVEVEYYRHGGILPYVLRQLLERA